MTRFLPILCLAAAAACAPTAAEVASNADRAAADSAKIDRALRGYAVDRTDSCLSDIDRRTARSTEVGSTILYRIGSNRIVRNDMNGNCPLGRQDAILVTQTPTGQLCRGDITQLVDRTSRFPVGSCIYGDFVTYRKAQ